jgi:predicted GNAT family acetyltransferase
MKIDRNSLKVIHNSEAQRFEIHIGVHKPVLDYRLREGVITFTHTGVPKELEGNGIGGFIVRTGLDYAREQGYKVIPLCPFVGDYIRRHNEYTDLLMD